MSYQQPESHRRRATASTEQHCGVCAYVYFADDWDRTPHCSKDSTRTEITPGSVCSDFVTQHAVTGDRENE